MACSVTPLSWGGCLSSLLGKAASSAAGSAFTAIANYFADAAKSATAWLWNAMGQASAVQLGGPGWATDLGITVGLALVVGSWPVLGPGDRQCRPERHGRHGPGRTRPVRGLPRWGCRRGHNRALVGGRGQHRQRDHGRRDRVLDLGEPRPAGHRHQRAEGRYRQRSHFSWPWWS